MKLKQEQVDFFQQHGYLAYGALLDAKDLAQLRECYDEEFARAWENNGFRNIARNNGGTAEEKKTANTRMFQIMNLCERNIRFRALLYKPEILDVVESLIGPNIMLFHDQALFKPARDGGAVPWHQDNGYWRCSPANLVSCWITLDDVTAENGAMNVIPGSHLRPVRHERNQKSDALLDTEVDATEAVVVGLKAGGCMFHHCQTLHYTRPNTTDRQRRAFAIHFMAPGTVDRDGKLLKVGFNRPLLRMCV